MPNLREEHSPSHRRKERTGSVTLTERSSSLVSTRGTSIRKDSRLVLAAATTLVRSCQELTRAYAETSTNTGTCTAVASMSLCPCKRVAANTRIRSRNNSDTGTNPSHGSTERAKTILETNVRTKAGLTSTVDLETP